MRFAGRWRRFRHLVLGMAVAGMPAIALAVDSWSISIGVRETGTSAAIGDDGGTSGAIEWVNLDGQSIIADGLWHQYTWNFGTDPVTNFSGGNGVLSSATMKGTLENIRIVNSGGNVGGAINLRIDDIVNTVGGTPTTVTGFETVDGFNTSLTSSQPMFREPIFSTTTLANMSTGLNSTLVSTIAHTGNQSVAARWSFVPNGSTTEWLRLSTSNATVMPNPTIDFTSGNSLSLWLRASVVNPSGTRAFGVDVSSNQGTGIDWNKVAQPASTGGGGLTFAFIRSTRGGTSGTSSTGAMRVDDTTFTYNITNAKAAGMLTGPYHFGRPDMWTAGDANGLTDAPGTVGTPEDEARHMLEIAGKYMKVGYMRPVYDLEDGGAEQNVNQMSNFVHRFANTLMKYKGPGAKIIVYAGQTYSVSEVNSSVSTYPLWRPQWPSDPDPWAADPTTVEANYGAWDPPGTGNPMPWSFWQYNSPDVYIPGINGSGAITHNDIDVAHGDVNYVKGFLIQGSIWDGSTSAVWATAANWDTNAEPTSTTEVLLDGPVPGTGSSITLSNGRAASGIYFAESYALTGGSLTLGDGRIDVDATKSATIATNLSTPNGFRKVGTGSLTHTSGTSTVTGIAQVLQGTMNVSGGSIAVSGNLLVNPELTQFDKSLVAPFPTVGQITNSNLTINGGSVSAAAAFVGGSDTTSGAIGRLTVSSGSLSVMGALKIWNSAVPLVDSKVNFSGGSMSLGSLNTDGNVTSFNWTGGTLTIGGDNSSSTFNAAGSGSASLVKTGAGVVTLAVANTYSGTTTVSGGTLRAGVNSAISTSTDLSVSSGTFDLNGFTMSIRGLSGSGSITLGSGALTVSPVGLSVFAGAISESGSLSKSGTGTITLSGTNTYTGATTVSAGTLQIGNGGTTGSLANNGGIVDNSSVIFNRSDAYNYGGAISGTGTVTKLGGGTLTLSGVSSYSSGTDIQNGTLSGNAIANQGSNSAFGTGNFSIANGAKLEYSGADASTNRNISLGAGGGLLSVSTASTVLTASGTISGSALTKAGAGTVVLTGPNSYSGGTTVSAGLLAVTGATATFGSGNVTVLDAGTGAGGGLLIQTGVLNAIADNAMLSLSGGSTPDVADVGFAFLEAGINDRIGALVLGGVAQTNGLTYGSTASSALFKSDEYFSVGGSGILAVGQTGDFNSDGSVDAGDYVVWCKSPATYGGNAGYDLWRASFGQLGSGAGATVDSLSNVVPEPSTLLLLALAAASVCFLPHRKVTQVSKLDKT